MGNVEILAFKRDRYDALAIEFSVKRTVLSLTVYVIERIDVAMKLAIAYITIAIRKENGLLKRRGLREWVAIAPELE